MVADSKSLRFFYLPQSFTLPRVESSFSSSKA